MLLLAVSEKHKGKKKDDLNRIRVLLLCCESRVGKRNCLTKRVCSGKLEPLVFRRKKEKKEVKGKEQRLGDLGS